MNSTKHLTYDVTVDTQVATLDKVSEGVTSALMQRKHNSTATDHLAAKVRPVKGRPTYHFNSGLQAINVPLHSSGIQLTNSSMVARRHSPEAVTPEDTNETKESKTSIPKKVKLPVNLPSRLKFKIEFLPISTHFKDVTGHQNVARDFKFKNIYKTTESGVIQFDAFAYDPTGKTFGSWIYYDKQNEPVTVLSMNGLGGKDYEYDFFSQGEGFSIRCRLRPISWFKDVQRYCWDETCETTPYYRHKVGCFVFEMEDGTYQAFERNFMVNKRFWDHHQGKLPDAATESNANIIGTSAAFLISSLGSFFAVQE